MWFGLCHCADEERRARLKPIYQKLYKSGAHYVVDSLADVPPILEQINAELAKVAWVPRDGLSITVKNGVVDLRGVILEEKGRDALRVVAENTAGVKAVEDHLVWIEPVSGTVLDPGRNEKTS